MTELDKSADRVACDELRELRLADGAPIVGSPFFKVMAVVFVPVLLDSTTSNVVGGGRIDDMADGSVVAADICGLCHSRIHSQKCKID